MSNHLHVSNKIDRKVVEPIAMSKNQINDKCLGLNLQFRYKIKQVPAQVCSIGGTLCSKFS